ncbi:MAG TPA: hypothetical protein VFJ74_06420 [Gemmatimonadaceae bacterium]|nr:hypothetical protein [Gemmatimonadaceae bacterium]
MPNDSFFDQIERRVHQRVYLLARRSSAALRAAAGVAVLAAGAAGCGPDSTTGPVTRPAGDLFIVRRAAGTPPLVSTTASFWAVKGADRELRMYYQPAAGSGGSVGAQFLRLRVRPATLDRLPDGSVIANGDSVLITVTADPTLMVVDFQPSGLRFSAAEPAELEVSFAECDGDYNGNGVIDNNDIAIRSTLAIWKHETATDPWTKLGTTLLSTNAAQSKLSGFTGYAVAY